ncbi:hypothetical protein AB0425_25825 [Actinosynnema sp. NPDC051121]
MNDPITPRPLGEFATDEFPRPAVVSLDNTEAVVLGLATADTVWLWHDGTISPHPATTLVFEIASSDRCQLAIRRALLNLNHQRIRALQQCVQADEGLSRTLRAIRAYAITKHREGIISQRQLNEFLAHFNLHPSELYLRLEFRLTGSYEVAGTDTMAARTSAVTALAVAGTGGISGLVPNSLSYRVAVTDVSIRRPEITTLHVHVGFDITGQAVIRSPYRTRAHNEAERLLAPDLSGVPAVVPDSLTYGRRVALELRDDDTSEPAGS